MLNTPEIAYKRENPEKKWEIQIVFDQKAFESTMKEISKEAELYNNTTFKTYIEQWLAKYWDYLWKLVINLWKVNVEDANKLVNELNQWLLNAFIDYENRENNAEFTLRSVIDTQSPVLAKKITELRDNNQSWWDKIRKSLRWIVPWNSITKYAEWPKINE